MSDAEFGDDDGLLAVDLTPAELASPAAAAAATDGRKRKSRAATNRAAASAAAKADGSESDASDASDAPSKKKRKSAAPRARKSKAAAADDDDASATESEADGERKSNQRSSKKRASAAPAAAAKPKKRKSRESQQHPATEEEEKDAAEAFFASDSATGLSAADLRALREDSGQAPVFASDVSKIAPTGIIKRMSIRNFMNYRKFEITFNPNVNFLHGANGSGKSSILHAIQLVFGAHAKETSRGSNVAALISHGKEEAVITAWVKNEGENAYKPDIFGDEIEVQRIIRRTGTKTAFKLSGTGKDGRTYALKTAADVREMCNYFNIQVSNPCVVMTQEVSKKFLSSQKPEDKYEFFVRATQMDQLREKLREAHLKVKDMESIIAIQRDKLPDLDREIARLEKQEKLAQEAVEVEKEIVELAGKMAWRAVKDLEIEYDLNDTRVKDLQAAIAKSEAKLAAATEAAQSKADHEAETAVHQQAMRDASKKKADCVAAIQSKDEETRRVKAESREVLVKLKALRGRIDSLRAKRKREELQIQAIAEKNSVDTSNLNAARDEKKRVLAEEREALQTEKERLTAGHQALHVKEMEARQEESALVTERQTVQAVVNRLTSDLKQMQNAQAAHSSSAAAAGGRRFHPAFGTHTHLIWREIERAKWTEKPIGPLGEYVQIKECAQIDRDHSWLSAVEECLTQRHMATYIVTNAADADTFKKILAKVWREHAIDPSTFKPNTMILRKPAADAGRYPVQKPAVPFPLVIDMIAVEDPGMAPIDNDWAYNAIVFLCKVERWGLHRELNEAIAALKPYRVMHGDDDAATVVSSASAAASASSRSSNDFVSGSHLLNGTQVSIKGQSAEGSTTVFAAAGNNRMFRISQEAAIENKDRALQAKLAEANAVQERLQAKHREVMELSRNPSGPRLRQIAVRLQKLDSEIESIEYEAERAAQDQAKQDDTPHRDAITRIENEIGEVNGEIAEVESSDSKVFTDRLAALKSDIDQLTAQMADAEKEQEAEAAWLKDLVRRWGLSQLQVQKYTKRLQQQQAEFASAEVKFSDVSQRLGTAEVTANVNHPERVDSDESHEALNARHSAKCHTLAEKRRKEPIDLARTQIDLKNAQKAKAQLEATTSHVHADLDVLQKMGKARRQRMKAQQLSLAESASFTFNELLRRQGGHGELEFNHSEHLLHMVVNPDRSDADRQDATNSVVLSGGERSVTTIAFVMAIGEQVESPFRAIDEFDVFMDSVNRRTSVDLLLSIAGMRKDRQFFFLSPQDISGLKPNEYFSVFKLPDPPRSRVSAADDQLTLSQFTEAKEAEADE